MFIRPTKVRKHPAAYTAQCKSLRGIGVFTLSIVICTPVLADSPAISANSVIPFKAIEVSNAVLASMRGRYVSPTAIMYFGVEMNTSWKTASGQNFSTGLFIGVHPNDFHPTVTILSRIGGNSSATSVPGGDAPVKMAQLGGIQSGGLSNVQGVAQAVQVTGDTNAAHNQITFSLGNAPSNNAPHGDGWNPGITHASTVGSGDNAGTLLSVGQAGVKISIPGQGVAQQIISSQRGLQQQIQLAGNLNNVLNQTSITATFQNLSHLSTIDISGALESIRNLPRTGMY